MQYRVAKDGHILALVFPVDRTLFFLSVYRVNYLAQLTREVNVYIDRVLKKWVCDH